MKLLLERNLGNLQFEIYDQKPNFEVVKLKQVHGPLVVSYEEAKTKEIEADGMVLPKSFQIPAVIITADCLPILIQGKKGFAFLHAGWRGLHNQIMNHPLIKELEPRSAYIGPHIKACCFEVQPDFKSNFPQEHFYQVRGNKLYCDLTQIAQTQLKSFYHLSDIEIEKSCTCCTLQFKSFRRDGTIDRNWNIIKINK